MREFAFSVFVSGVSESGVVFHILNRAMALPDFGLLVSTGADLGSGGVECRFRVTARAAHIVEQTARAALLRELPDSEVQVHVPHAGPQSAPPVHTRA